jgi:hypothetical protein
VHLPVLLRQGQAGHYAGDDYMALKDNNGSLVKAITIKPLFGGIIGLMMLLISILLAWWAEGGFPRPRAHSGS